MPSMVSPKGFQAQEGFVALGGPELAGAFEPALVLAAGRFHGSRTQGLVGQLELLLSGRAVVPGLSGIEDRFVFHPVLIVLEVFDLGLELFLLSLLQAGLEFLETGNDGAGLVLMDLFQERSHPSPRLGGAFSIKIIG